MTRRNTNSHGLAGKLRMGKTLGAVVAVMFFILCGCREMEESSIEDRHRPTQVAESFTLTETISGERVWCLKADKALSYEDENLIKVYGVTIEFYKEGGHYSTLTSEEGIYYTLTADMEAFGEVVVESEEGRLETETLNWVAREEKIRTDDYVRITKGETVITGRGLESDPSLESVKIEKEFQAYSREVEQGETKGKEGE